MRKQELKRVTSIVVLILVLAAAVMAFVRAAPSTPQSGSDLGIGEPNAISEESDVHDVQSSQGDRLTA